MTWRDNREFVRCVEHLLDLEGGYSDHPADRGGKTNFGITQASYPDLDIAALTADEAKEIYYRDYWEPHGWDRLPVDVARAAFLLSVNTGPRRAIKVLQRAVRAATGIAVKDDGDLGPRTVRVASRAAPAVLVAAFRSEQAGYYRMIAQQSPELRAFQAGWLSRAYEDVAVD